MCVLIAHGRVRRQERRLALNARGERNQALLHHSLQFFGRVSDDEASTKKSITSIYICSAENLLQNEEPTENLLKVPAAGGEIEDTSSHEELAASAPGNMQQQSISYSSGSPDALGLREDSKNGLQPLEYVQLILEAVHFSKNVLIGRHFHKLDKDWMKNFRGSPLFNHRKRLTVDMWPTLLTPLPEGEYDLAKGGSRSASPVAVEAMQDDSDVPYDGSAALTVLLGYVLKQTDVWTRYSKLRVKGITFTAQAAERETARLAQLLVLARIKSRVEVEWVRLGLRGTC